MSIGRWAALMVITLIFVGTAFASLNARGSPVFEKVTGRMVYREARPYITHAVIKINGNSDFTSENGVVDGSGTSSDPYIISGWDIDAQGAESAIYIGNTTKHFVVRDCHLHNATVGIWLYRVSNGTVANNTVSNNLYGIYLSESNESLIENNTVDNSSTAGILLRLSAGITLRNNTLQNNGIFLSEDMNTLTNQDIDTSNTVNGKPVYYYKNVNMNNASVPEDAGQVILGNVSWLKIENLWIENATVGIEVGYSSHITIANSTIRGNSKYGIYVENSDDSRVENNTVSNNSQDGIYMYGSDGSIVRGNTVINNSQEGILLSNSDNSKIENNTVSGNGYDGIYVRFYSERSIITGNRVSNNYWSGIHLDNTIGIRMEKNTVINNSRSGILVGDSYWCEIEGNTVSNNSQGGIYLVESDRNTIVGNLITNNREYGVYIYRGENNLIYNNSFYFNHGSSDSYDSSHVQAYDSSGSNYWNTSDAGSGHGYGNYWHDWANNNDTNDPNGDGIVDWPYLIAGTSGARDQYPLTVPTEEIPEISPVPMLMILFAIFVLLRRR